MYDTIIVGAGPAGLSAAVYLGRFKRSVLVVDNGHGRSNFGQTNNNYLGFPEGITSRELRERGAEHAKKFGAQFENATVEKIDHAKDNTFTVVTTRGPFDARTVLIATGVTDIWPPLREIDRFIGTQVFWCITCDGAHVIDRAVLCIGNDDEAAVTTLQLCTYTRKLVLVVDPKSNRISDAKQQALAARQIEIVLGVPDELEIIDGTITGVILKNSKRLSCECIFSLLGVMPNSIRAQDCGASLDQHGYIVVDDEGMTNVPGVFAAGDVTNKYTQQISSAVHSGAEAGQTINYFLHGDTERNPWDEGRVLHR